jgi:patatin-like phospholipase/acyl hydrolase
MYAEGAAITNVIVTSWDMAYSEPVFFSSRPRSGWITDVGMLIVARATSAGPTYFEPQVMVDGQKQRVLVDGGVFINNPAMLAFVAGLEAAEGRPIDLLALGTGTRNPSDHQTVLRTLGGAGSDPRDNRAARSEVPKQRGLLTVALLEATFGAATTTSREANHHSAGGGASARTSSRRKSSRCTSRRATARGQTSPSRGAAESVRQARGGRELPRRW